MNINAGKTEFISINQGENEKIKSLNGKDIKKVSDFKYLGSYIQSTEKDMNIRLAKSWAALNKMNAIWKSRLPDRIKRNFFRATVESVLVYGSVSWTLTKALEKRLSGNYTRMLRAILNKSWKDHHTNKEIYANIPDIYTSIRQQRLRFSVGEISAKWHQILFYGNLPMVREKEDGREEHTLINSWMIHCVM